MDLQARSTGLDERSREILDAVVRLNVETGRAVSSGLVERALGRRVSSATIRAVMKDLAGRGYLDQPHTSAGRVPTDLGYRSFVDRLREGWGLRRHEAPVGMRRQLQRALDAGAGTGEVRELARLLSDLTDSVSIVVGPSWEDVPVARLEVAPRGERHALAVVFLDNGRVRTGLMDLRRSWPPAVLEAAARRADRRARGLTVGEIRRGALDAPDLEGTPATRCAAEVARGCRAVLEELADGELELQGVARVLEEPEFDDPAPLKALVRFMESPRAVRTALARLDRPRGEELSVWIGAENPVDQLRRFAVVVRGFAVDRRRGLLAVLGPRRMFYQRAFHGLDLLGRALEESPGRLAG